jgi:DHA2 family multidrug resistance protein
VFHLDIFRDRNFAIATVLMTFFGLGLYGAIVLTPMMLEMLLNYPTATTGWMMAPRGVASMISMIMVGRFINHIQPRVLVLAGMALGALGSWAMTRYTIDIGTWSLVWPVLLQGFGLGLVFVPLSAVAFSTLPHERSAEAAGVYSLTRTIGGSVGISIVATMMAREAQVSWNQLSAHVNPYNPAVQHYLGGIGMSVTDPRAVGLLAHEVARQAQMLGMVDAFVLVMWSFILMLPFVLLLGKVHHPDVPAATAAAAE